MANGTTPSPRPSDPRQAFRMALSRYKPSRLAAIRQARGMPPVEDRIRPVGTSEELTEQLDHPWAIEAISTRLPAGSRLAMSLMAVAEATAMSAAGLARALEILGVEPIEALVPLLGPGLLVIEPNAELGPVDDLATALAGPRVQLAAHPTVLRAARPVRPEGRPAVVVGDVGQVREPDGLEPIVRLGALWQRAGAEPIRQTQQGALYKRDRERVMDDPALAGPVADALALLPDPAGFWLALARRVGLVEPDASGQKLMAASPEFWSENAVHLPQMIATGWFSLRDWQETAAATAPDADDADEPSMPYLRPAVLLWLATLGESEWVAIDDLAEHLSSIAPGWDRPTIAPTSAVGPSPSPVADPPRRSATLPRGRARSAPEPARGAALLETMLLGAAYALGLVSAAEERGTGRRAVRLTPLGRYVLAAGPTPPPRPTFDQFLFVQPNFEVIAYRQGLTPRIVGRLSRFAWWSQVGAAIELKLTRESILFGLDGGLTPQTMLDLLRRHSQRDLPAGVVDAVRNWATHRERVTYYAASTLIEFHSTDDRDRVLESWPREEAETGREPPVAVADRFLLVEDEQSIPFSRFISGGSRDYGQKADVCAMVEPDGVTMTLDRSKSDLLVDAELGRFADERPGVSAPREAGESVPRRFAVTIASLRRAVERGLTTEALADWYVRRTGGGVPPAVRLLLASAAGEPIAPPEPSRWTVLTLPEPWMLDGLIQHPTTARWLGDRLGPRSVVIPEEHLDSLRKALRDLGITLESN